MKRQSHLHYFVSKYLRKNNNTERTIQYQSKTLSIKITKAISV